MRELIKNNISGFLNEFKDIIKKYNDLNKNKEKYRFNIFSISTYTSHLENFHSDILHSLLTVNGQHEEGTLFITKFFDYLKNNLNIKLENIDFENIKVEKEKGDKEGRIDILIIFNEKKDSSKKAIIIENKINNAVDQDNQLEKYYNWCVREGYKVVSILYASLDGYKLAPRTNNEKIDKLIKNIAFFNDNDKTCLVNGWFKKCEPKTDDTKAFLNQYIKLLIFLGYNTMEENIMKDFYEKIGKEENFENIKILNELYFKLPKYRAAKFFNIFKDNTYGFSRLILFKENYPLFESYKGNINGNNLKIDIEFILNGNVNIRFWNNCDIETETKTKKSFLDDHFNNLSNKCKTTLKKQINKDGSIWYVKEININEHSSISDIDEKVIKFVFCLLKDLSKI